MGKEADPPTLTIAPINPTYEGYGMVLDFLSRRSPFADFALSEIGPTIRMQLKQGNHLVAINSDHNLVGYMGWAFTKSSIAERWLCSGGSLEIHNATREALLVNVFVSVDQHATSAMIRKCRDLHVGVRAYFKRTYQEAGRSTRKHSVLNAGSRVEAEVASP